MLAALCSRTRPGAGGKRTGVAVRRRDQRDGSGQHARRRYAGGQPGRLTRAQVKQELLRAQKSGELERLNQLYEGGQ